MWRKEHYCAEEVRASLPPSRLLVFDVRRSIQLSQSSFPPKISHHLEYKVRDGWAPLCSFLGLAEPSTPFPRSNSGEQVSISHFSLFYFPYMKTGPLHLIHPHSRMTEWQKRVIPGHLEGFDLLVVTASIAALHHVEGPRQWEKQCLNPSGITRREEKTGIQVKRFTSQGKRYILHPLLIVVELLILRTAAEIETLLLLLES